MNPSPEIQTILEDRESGSVALLNRLVTALEQELVRADQDVEHFMVLLEQAADRLCHFAAIENFLAGLMRELGQQPGLLENARTYLSDYRAYWQDSTGKITDRFLMQCQPENKTILTHSHSETVISLLSELHIRQVPFRVIQTLSTPGGEGRRSHERMQQLGMRSTLIDDAEIDKYLPDTDLVLVGCDALLEGEFLNKTGTRVLLEKARESGIPSCVVTESRKKITWPDWKRNSSVKDLFEWVPLHLIDRIITER